MEEIWKGAAKRLEDTDLPRIGHEIGVGEDELHAFLDVEAAGVGFDDKGRLKMLFEPHIFWRELGPGRQRDLAVSLGLAYQKWRPGRYPKDSYPSLMEAMRINRTAALRSASWGLGQIMGFNHEAAGYPTVEAMIKDFAADEDRHVAAMVRFIKTRKLDDDLRRHDWGAIEKGYNGGGHGGAYARKMRERFAWWQKRPDTPWTPSEKYQGEDADEPIIGIPQDHSGDVTKKVEPAPNTSAAIAKWVIGAVGAIIAAALAYVGFGGQ